jgi:hypothetical protein
LFKITHFIIEKDSFLTLYFFVEKKTWTYNLIILSSSTYQIY